MKKLMFTVMVLAAAALPAWAQDEATDEATFSDGELQQLLAPIALYPDTVLAHILIAATYPLEVVEAERWVSGHEGMEPEDAMTAVEDEDWDPSVKALVPFPHILTNMSEDLDWTENLGEAFLQDEAAVMAAIQDLRHRAYEEGNLNSLEHLNVTEDKETIVIEPATREVVYIPYYDARVIYGPWFWPAYPPFYWDYPGHIHYVSYYPGIYWGPRVHISFGFFFSSFQWHSHRLVVVDYHPHSYRRFYFGYQVANYRDAHHWQHDTHHRRGVAYRNPRTRDYFENQHRNYDRPRDQRHHRFDDNDRNRVQRQLQAGRSSGGFQRNDSNQHRQQTTHRNESTRTTDRNRHDWNRDNNATFGRSRDNSSTRDHVRRGRTEQPAASERTRHFNTTDETRLRRTDNGRRTTRVERSGDVSNNRRTETRGRYRQAPPASSSSNNSATNSSENKVQQRQPVKTERAQPRGRSQSVERGRSNQGSDRRSSGSEKTHNRGRFRH